MSCKHASLIVLALVLLCRVGILQADTQGSRESNRDVLIDLLGTALGCRISEEFMVDLPVSSLYSNAAGACEAINAENAADGFYFADPACQNEISFRETGQLEFCNAALDKSALGNADDLQGQPSFWTLSPGNRYDLGARRLAGLSQPFMTRTTYREVETAGGTCRLEMRVYKSSPAATGLKSIIMLHGGSWTSRGFGFFGMETTIPNFTDAGFVVFAPFYRLLDEKEANTACHNASITEIVDDAHVALDWVIDNAASFGGSDYPVVFGQSAGAHLAASLAVHETEKVSNAVLFYPPTDFTDFALRALDGSYTDEQGLGILERVMGTTVDAVDLSASPVPENTFPTIVEPNPSAFPPMFFLHGLEDTLVEARQSVRLCHALAGNIESGAVPANYLEIDSLRQRYDCNANDSEIHLAKEGDHALDVCISSSIFFGDTCLSGSEESRVEVGQAIDAASNWASRIADKRAELRNPGTDETPPETTGDSGGSGGGTLLWALAGLLYLVQLRYRKFGAADK